MNTKAIDLRALLAGTHVAGTWTLTELARAVEAEQDEASVDAVHAMLDALDVDLHTVGIDLLDVLENLSDEVRGRTAGELDVLDGRERGFTHEEEGEALEYMVAHASYRHVHVLQEGAEPVGGERARVRFGASHLALS